MWSRGENFLSGKGGEMRAGSIVLIYVASPGIEPGKFADPQIKVSVVVNIESLKDDRNKAT